MPSASAKQHRFMEAVAHNPAFAKKVGISQSVGKDFSAADKGKKFGRGGAINKQDTQHGSMDMPFKSLKKFGGMKSGGMARGGMPPGAMAAMRRRRMGASMPPSAPPVMPPQPPVMPPAPMGMKKGGMANFEKSGKDAEKKGMKEGSKADMAMDKKQMMGMNMGGMTRKFGKGGMHKMPDGKMMKNSAMNMGGMAGMKKGGMPMKDGKPAFMMGKKMNMGGMAKYAGGGGIESRGKTKGTVIRMASGGSVSSASRRADGIAQRGKTRC